MTLWTEEGDLGSSKMERRLEYCNIILNRNFMKWNFGIT